MNNNFGRIKKIIYITCAFFAFLAVSISVIGVERNTVIESQRVYISEEIVATSNDEALAEAEANDNVTYIEINEEEVAKGTDSNAIAERNMRFIVIISLIAVLGVVTTLIATFKDHKEEIGDKD